MPGRETAISHGEGGSIGHMETIGRGDTTLSLEQHSPVGNLCLSEHNVQEQGQGAEEPLRSPAWVQAEAASPLG